MSNLRDKISDLITAEIYDRFESPSAAVIGVKLADAILALPELQDMLESAMVLRINAKAGGGLRP